MERTEARADAIGAESHPTREVRHEYTLNFPRILEHLGASLLVSTYQAGKVVVVGSHSGELDLSYHNFEKAMGIAVRPGELAVCARAAIWFLNDDQQIAKQLDPAGTHEACYLAQSAKDCESGSCQLPRARFEIEILSRRRVSKARLRSHPGRRTRRRCRWES